MLVNRLRQAGAIVIGKATTPEFGVKGLTDGPSFGMTRNPWNLERTPGGSMGGGAAAVAAGLGRLSLGTDGAGSIRGPASCSGLVGLKPTFGAVPIDGSRDGFGNNVYAGPLARSITDAAIMHSVLVGPSEKDPWSLARRRPASAVAQALRGRSRGRAHWLYRAHRQSARRGRRARQYARLPRGVEREGRGRRGDHRQDRLDRIRGPMLYQANFAVFCAQYLPKWQNQMDPVTLAFMERGAKFSLADFRNAQYARTALFRRIQSLFERYDFLVTPTNSRTALDVDADAANDEVVVDGVKCGITRQGWTSYQYPFNLTGHPAMAVPSGFGADGLPTSVQIVGKWGWETDVLRLGALLEGARPWAQHRPPALN